MLQWLLQHAGAPGWGGTALRRFRCRLLLPPAARVPPPDSALSPALSPQPSTVGLEYTDSAEALNAAAARAEAAAGPPEAWTEAQLPPLPDVTADDVRAALVQLQRMLHVDGSSGSGEATPEALQRAHAMLESCVLPALAELGKRQGAVAAAAAQQQAGAAQQAAAAAMLADYPLGFSTGRFGFAAASAAAAAETEAWQPRCCAAEPLVDPKPAHPSMPTHNTCRRRER